ncbi:hypothetical protein [Rosettibacter firmus]|uniref:hypothetical protein n=1 Tax=Rosettibacter firmus TaxID=3111522 RepID=UPI00336BD3FE
MPNNKFEDALMKDIFTKHKTHTGNLIKASDVEFKGYTKISVEEDEMEGVKIYLKKDANDVIKEIKFVCSCGQSKSIILDYE